MNSDAYAHLFLGRVRAVELRTEVDAHRYQGRTRRRPWAGRWVRLRSRAGWLLVEVGLRLVRPARPGVEPG